jgi:hypothetical protein
MNSFSPSADVIRALSFSLLLTTLALAATTASPDARAADTGSTGTVECMLPGEIHSVGGHPSMGARRQVQTTADDCKQRGGEYTVETQSATPALSSPVATTDNPTVRCQLPRQTRQLGSSAHYSTRSRIVHTTASDCQTKKGRVLPAVGTKH